MYTHKSTKESQNLHTTICSRPLPPPPFSEHHTTPHLKLIQLYMFRRSGGVRRAQGPGMSQLTAQELVPTHHDHGGLWAGVQLRGLGRRRYRQLLCLPRRQEEPARVSCGQTVRQLFPTGRVWGDRGRGVRKGAGWTDTDGPWPDRPPALPDRTSLRGII